MATLMKALQIAFEVHTKLDRGKKPYIFHPIRVALAQDFHDEEAQIVGILHDVVEDSHYTLDDLRELGFSDRVVAAVDAVTRRHKEDYFDFIERCKHNELGVKIKRADLKDNMNLYRLPNLSPKDIERYVKYCKAYNMLKD